MTAPVAAPLPIVEAFSVSHAQICDGTTSFLTYLASLELLGRENEDIYGVNEASLEPDTDDWQNEGDDQVMSEWSWLNYAEVSVQNGYISFPMIANLTGRPFTASGGTAEVQTITITGGPTGGTFILTYDGQATAPIAYNATAAAVRTALEALSNVAAGDVTTTGGPLPGTPVVVTFSAAEGDVPQMTVTHALTGGTAPAVAVTTTTPGTGGDAAAVYQMDLWHESSLNVAPRPMIIQMPSKDARGAPRLFTFGLYRVSFAPIAFEGPEYKEGLKINYGGKALPSRFDEAGVRFLDAKAKVGTMLSSRVL